MEDAPETPQRPASEAAPSPSDAPSAGSNGDAPSPGVPAGAGPPTATASPFEPAAIGAGGPAPRLPAGLPSNFVHKLYGMISDEANNKFIAWRPDGRSFVVVHIPAFSRDILPRYFKHTNYNSFVRQLNMYGFHKVAWRNARELRGKAGEQQQSEFVHPCFQRDQPELMKQVRRKTAGDVSQGSGPGPGPAASYAAAPARPAVLARPPVSLAPMLQTPVGLVHTRLAPGAVGPRGHPNPHPPDAAYAAAAPPVAPLPHQLHPGFAAAAASAAPAPPEAPRAQQVHAYYLSVPPGGMVQPAPAYAPYDGGEVAVMPDGSRAAVQYPPHSYSAPGPRLSPQHPAAEAPIMRAPPPPPPPPQQMHYVHVPYAELGPAATSAPQIDDSAHLARMWHVHKLEAAVAPLADRLAALERALHHTTHLVGELVAVCRETAPPGAAEHLLNLSAQIAQLSGYLGSSGANPSGPPRAAVEPASQQLGSLTTDSPAA